MIEVLFFAGLRERLGCDRVELMLPEGVTTIQGVRRHLMDRGNGWSDALGPSERIMVALNEQLCSERAEVKPGDRLALFPPVTGG